MLGLNSRPYLLLTLTMLMWGANAVAGKLAVGHVSPMLVTLLRWGLSVLIMTPFALADFRRDWPLIRRHLPLLFALGGLGFATFNALMYAALNYTSAINVTIEQAAMPLLVFAANFVLFRLRVTMLQIVGFVMTLFGVALTAAHGDLGSLFSLDLNKGDGLMMLAVCLYGGYTVAVRFKPAVHWRSMIYILSLSAFVTSIPYAAVEAISGNAFGPDLQGFLISLFIAIFPSLISQALYIRGIELIGPNRAGLFINLVPIFGAVLAVLVIGEELHLYHLGALIFVLGGIMLAERRARAAAVAEPEAKPAGNRTS